MTGEAQRSLLFGVFIACDGVRRTFRRVLCRVSCSYAHLLYAVTYALAYVFCTLDGMACDDIMGRLFAAVPDVLGTFAVPCLKIRAGLLHLGAGRRRLEA